jgi:glyceraldehyde-3-phosphate dehydrogenase/erythrose-4-phosphate dehydrogenase
MTIRVGIDGCGRLGRLVFQALGEQSLLGQEVCAHRVVDLLRFMAKQDGEV